MLQTTTPPCCEAWDEWAKSAGWFIDTQDIHRMPHLLGTRHRFNYCPSCGAERRSAIICPGTRKENFDD
jgi:hypothetical protein